MSCLVKKSGEIISKDTIDIIRERYERITRAINREFWKDKSTADHSLLVGSYGRGTAIDTSDIDVLVELPQSEYERYDSQKGNGQSRLLQAVRSVLQTTYSRSNISGDGQVVKIEFSDGVKFEILPAFLNMSCYSQSYTYPDSNMGGNWKSTNPKLEQEAMKKKNISSNGLLFDTCRHFRRVRDEYFCGSHLSGIVIDSFIYEAMGNWHWVSDGEISFASHGDYEKVLYNYLVDKYSLYGMPVMLKAPGSNQAVNASSSIECLKKVVDYIAN